jgi:hypothetical protein
MHNWKFSIPIQVCHKQLIFKICYFLGEDKSLRTSGPNNSLINTDPSIFNNFSKISPNARLRTQVDSPPVQPYRFYTTVKVTNNNAVLIHTKFLSCHREHPINIDVYYNFSRHSWKWWHISSKRRKICVLLK